MPAAQQQAVTMYTTAWCGDCIRLKRELNREGFVYREINIETDPAAADHVIALNRGNRTVPTLVFEDGTVMAEPQTREVIARLRLLASA